MTGIKFAVVEVLRLTDQKILITGITVKFLLSLQSYLLFLTAILNQYYTFYFHSNFTENFIEHKF